MENLAVLQITTFVVMLKKWEMEVSFHVLKQGINSFSELLKSKSNSETVDLIFDRQETGLK